MHRDPCGEPGSNVHFRRHHAAVPRCDEDVVERETSGNELVGERFVFHASFSPMTMQLSRSCILSPRLGRISRTSGHFTRLCYMAKKPNANLTLIPTERIERSILLIRGHKVLLDMDLAVLYGVETK